MIVLPRDIRRLFRLYRGHGDVEADVDAEIEFHLRSKMEALIATGMRPDAARNEAVRQFGDVWHARNELAAIDHRDTGHRLKADWLDAAWSDLRFAARSLVRTPGFTVVVVLTLALGLGATAAMFGLLDRLLLRPPIGVRDPERVARLYVHERDRDRERLRSRFLYQELHALDGADSLVGVAFWGSAGDKVPVTDNAGAFD